MSKNNTKCTTTKIQEQDQWDVRSRRILQLLPIYFILLLWAENWTIIAS